MISIRRTLAGLTKIQPEINYHYLPFPGKGLYHLAHPQFFVLVGISLSLPGFSPAGLFFKNRVVGKVIS
jgi:hypothetical protein